MKIKVCTFSLRCDTEKDGINSFTGRRELIRREFPKYGADVIGFQEVLPHMHRWLAENLTGYTVVGTGRDVNRSGEETCIAYRTDMFDLVGMDTFWLSDTPRVPGSRYGTDQSKYPRICTAAVLITREERKILRVYNTHLDHVGPVARAQGISAVLSRIEEDESVYPNTPVVLTGDLNDTPDALAIQSITAFRDGMLRDIAADVGPTLHLYHPENTEKYIKIDYIFTNAHRGEMEATCLTDVENGVYFSDHYPVLGEIEI
jgi:endonuclease/exonuclease/phosphatase family metal-dependent hydrolase